MGTSWIANLDGAEGGDVGDGGAEGYGAECGGVEGNGSQIGTKMVQRVNILYRHALLDCYE